MINYEPSYKLTEIASEDFNSESLTLFKIIDPINSSQQDFDLDDKIAKEKPKIVNIPTTKNIIKLNHSRIPAIRLQNNYLKVPITKPNDQKTIIQLDITSTLNNNSMNENKFYPKPSYSYSCLIAMAFNNCDTGHLPVNEIYEFIM